MKSLIITKAKRFIKKKAHSAIFKALAGLGRALNRFYENRNHDFYSNGELTVLKKIATFKPVVIIDGGANTGNYSLQIHQLIPEACIYSFEPVTASFKKLKRNVSIVKNIIPVRKGLYQTTCTKKIHLFPSDTHSSLYDIQGLSYKPSGEEIIELVSGDDFLKIQAIAEVDFLKLDIEGAEYDAILGFKESISQGKIRAIQFEYGYINITTKNLLIDYYNFFESNGYVVGKIFPKTVEFRKYEFKYEDFLGPNFIAVKKTETEWINALKKK